MGDNRGKLYGALRKCWKGYTIARAKVAKGENVEKEQKKMEYYSEGILKIRKMLGKTKGTMKGKPDKPPIYIDGLLYKPKGSKTTVIRGLI